MSKPIQPPGAPPDENEEQYRRRRDGENGPDPKPGDIAHVVFVCEKGHREDSLQREEYLVRSLGGCHGMKERRARIIFDGKYAPQMKFPEGRRRSLLRSVCWDRGKES